MRAGFQMKCFAAALSISLFTLGGLAEPFSLFLGQNGQQLELSVPATITNSAQGSVMPEYEVQYSVDLNNWLPIGGKVRAIAGLSGNYLQISVDQQQGPIFYRVIANTGSTATNELGSGGAQTLGYDTTFSTQLGEIGLLSIQDFATNGGSISYLPQLSWDPTTAQFWPNFSSANIYTDSVPDWFMPGSPVPYTGSTNILYNYVLDTNELALFMTNGFVVSERLGSASFGDAYYRLFNADLPVFVTADSVLHAWHRSYQAMLSEVEEKQMSPLLLGMITNMSAQLPAMWQQYGQGPLGESILDADYILTVARSLSVTQQVASALSNPVVDNQVASTLSAISTFSLVYNFPIFGSARDIDFSQFIVRGHYADSATLSQYFEMMMWCSQIDLRVVTFAPEQESDIRELGTALVMYYLLEGSGQFGNWSNLEDISRTFVGVSDSMTFGQLGDLLANANIRSPADVPSLATLTNLQTRLLSGELGVQSIQGDFLLSPYSPEQLKLPRTFTICGQKFVMDSWALSQTVFDRVLWTPDYGTNIVFGKVYHRKPSCLDMAFSVLGNDQVVPNLVERMTNENGVPFRDGPHLPYQHNLLAVRRAIDGQAPSVWKDNIYNAWLGALRTLSAPTTGPEYPESMRTRAWAMKTLNTQLASWTQLRHDTLLYAKESYTASILCSYPAGFVEPRPEFWHSMTELCGITADAISKLPSNDPRFFAVRSNQLAFLTNFITQVTMLESISRAELAQQPLSVEQTDFLKNVIEIVAAYSNYRQWNGWYPTLYYQTGFSPSIWEVSPCDQWDASVTDVHTDPPDLLFSGDPGAVIHEGIANVNLLLVAIDNGPDTMVYAGPVLSHYEFEMSGITRLTDAQWRTNVLVGQRPPPPEWTKSYLVPGTITIPLGNQ